MTQPMVLPPQFIFDPDEGEYAMDDVVRVHDGDNFICVELIDPTRWAKPVVGHFFFRRPEDVEHLALLLANGANEVRRARRDAPPKAPAA